MSKRNFQHERPNPRKPHVHKIFPGGMWWTTVYDTGGKYHSHCFFNYEDAMAKARELAAMNAEAAK